MEILFFFKLLFIIIISVGLHVLDTHVEVKATPGVSSLFSP